MSGKNGHVLDLAPVVASSALENASLAKYRRVRPAFPDAYLSSKSCPIPWFCREKAATTTIVIDWTIALCVCAARSVDSIACCFSVVSDAGFSICTGWQMTENGAFLLNDLPPP